MITQNSQPSSIIFSQFRLSHLICTSLASSLKHTFYIDLISVICPIPKPHTYIDQDAYRKDDIEGILWIYQKPLGIIYNQNPAYKNSLTSNTRHIKNQQPRHPSSPLSQNLYNHHH